MSDNNDDIEINEQSNNDVEYNSYLDELIIHLVKERPALYDLRVPSKEKSRENKQALWIQISNSMEDQLKPHEIEFRWKYLRENYLKARKKQKIKEEIARRSGMPLTVGRNKRLYAYRYYEIMQYLDESLDHQKKMQKLRKSRKTTCLKPSQKTKIIRKALIKEETSEELEVDFQNSSETTMDSETFDGDDFGLEASSELSTSELPTFEPQMSINRTRNNAELRKVKNECLTECSSNDKPSEIDNYLLRLGAGLKRLPYEVRCELEIEFLKRVLYEEKKAKVYSTESEAKSESENCLKVLLPAIQDIARYRHIR